MSTTVNVISAGDFVSIVSCEDKPVVIDVRTAAEFNNEYLGESINLPVQDATGLSLESCLSQCGCAGSETVYLLCGTGNRAQIAAKQLMKECANPLVVVDGGIATMKQIGITFKKGAGSVISLERQVRIVAGSLVLLGVVLGFVLGSTFFGISAFVGAGLVFAGVTDTCAMGMMLARMPWNRAG